MECFQLVFETTSNEVEAFGFRNRRQCRSALTGEPGKVCKYRRN
jgi:hypothetical protein